MVSNFAITGNTEILQVADAVAREKGIKKELVMEAMEEAIATVGRRKYGHEQHVESTIDAKTGAISLFRVREVVENAEDYHTEISLSDAKEQDATIELGGSVTEALPPIDFGRVSSQTFKQVLMQKIREAERDKQYEEFKDRVGEVVTGVVKRVEFGDYIIDFGKTETILPRNEVIPRESFRAGDRIRAYIVDVRRVNKGQQIILSRTHPGFLEQLFTQEVPEIYDGLVKIMGVARDPGSRAKLAVYSEDHTLDPVGACIGPRGARVTAVYNELQGEKIDIIQWSSDLATFTVNALSSKTKEMQVEVQRIIIDEDRHLIEAVIPDDHLSLAIGRRGQNVRLAAKLVDWNIDVMSETEESERRINDFNRISALFADALNVEEVIGQLLASEGFSNIEEVAYVQLEDLLSIEGFDEDLAQELQQRAEEYLQEQQAEFEKFLADNGANADLLELTAIDKDSIKILVQNDVKSKDDVAGLATDEFKEILPESGLVDAEIEELIMTLRQDWFDDEPEAEAAEGESGGEEAA